MKPCKLIPQQLYIYTGGAINRNVTFCGYCKSGYRFKYKNDMLLDLKPQEVNEFIEINS